MAADSLAPLDAGHTGRAGPDRLELLTALIDASSFDPLYRPDVIQIPGGHPIYPWECVVHACERTRTSGRDLCHEHGKQWSDARGNGVGKPEERQILIGHHKFAHRSILHSHVN